MRSFLCFCWGSSIPIDPFSLAYIVKKVWCIGSFFLLQIRNPKGEQIRDLPSSNEFKGILIGRIGCFRTTFVASTTLAHILSMEWLDFLRYTNVPRLCIQCITTHDLWKKWHTFSMKHRVCFSLVVMDEKESKIGWKSQNNF